MASEPQGALNELHRYLSGLTPPLRAAELFEALVVLPPERIAGEIQVWVGAQRDANPTTAISDFLFHALRKLYLFGELGVVDPVRAESFFDWLLPLAVESAPHDERVGLRARINAMTHRVTVVPTFSGNVPVPAVPAGVPVKTMTGQIPLPSNPPPVAPETSSTPEGEHFTLILDRIKREKDAGRNVDSDEALSILGQLFILASAASTRDELRDRIRRIPPLVPPSQLGNVFQLLGRSIPPWDIALPDEQKASCLPSAIYAMRRIVALSADDHEKTKRLRELINAAVEQFNAGMLYAAALMLDLARTIIVEARLDKNLVDRLAGDAAKLLDNAKLRDNLSERSRHALLRCAFAFFPSFGVERLLTELRGETKQERRRSLLALLEAWGPAAREGALRRLQTELTPGADTWVIRNMIYLLHRIPRESDATIDAELEILRQASSREQVIWVAKEAVVAIGTIRTQAAARLLIERLSEHENALIRGDARQGPVEERLKTVDRILVALAKVGTPEALRRIASHGLRTDAALGDTRGRMSVLATVDLTSSNETVDMLVAAIRAELPTGLGRVMGKAANTTPLIQALASTNTPAVRALFEEIATKHQRTDLGTLTSTALAQLGASAARATEESKAGSGVKQAGMLRPFGLAELVQSLADSKATGVLSIAGQDRKTRGRLVFEGGSILEAERSHLKDDEAFFDLIERPAPGWYTFAPGEAANGSVRADVAPLLAEGVRRHDELVRARVLVPDHAAFKHAGPRPTPHSEEKDPAFMKEVWRRTISGQAVGSWESELPADAFRVRRLTVHWLSEGALQDTSASD